VTALEEIQAVSAAMLQAWGPDAVLKCREVAAKCEAEGDYEIRDSFLQFAEEAEKLLQVRKNLAQPVAHMSAR
jgi:hypothetical protein